MKTKRPALIADLVGRRNNVLLQRARGTITQFETTDGSVRLVCMASKQHGGLDKRYWFGFLPHQKTFLEESESPWVAFVCGDDGPSIVIPWSSFHAWLPDLNTGKGTDAKWHVTIQFHGGAPHLALKAKAGSVDLTAFVVSV